MDAVSIGISCDINLKANFCKMLCYDAAPKPIGSLCELLYGGALGDGATSK